MSSHLGVAMKPAALRKTSRYGWHPDLPDLRDHIYAAPKQTLVELPPSVDLRPQDSPVYDQGQIGSCTANAIAAAFEFDVRKQLLGDFVPSRLFIYYNERSMEGDVGTDSGAQIRDGVKSVAKLGVCPEAEWPYDATPATSDGGPFPADSRAAIEPTADCYSEAMKNQVTSYQRVTRTLSQFKGCLASGYPFLLGFSVYDSFEGEQIAKDGVLNLPQPEEKPLGGHAVLAVGYDDATQRFTIRNSWGDGWGQKGYFTMPYAYLLEAGLSSDFWTIRLVE
jgi:C1A family cysteine protease